MKKLHKLAVSFARSTRNLFSVSRKRHTAIWLLGLLPLDLQQANADVHTHPAISRQELLVAEAAPVTPLADLITETLENNPEIQAALREREAARHSISPAAALDDPVLEAGVINAPLTSAPFNREDMTMKMIGLSQRFPFPGKRALRGDIASKEAQAVEHAYQETVNRVVRDLKVAYADLWLTLETTQLFEKNKLAMEGLLHLAEQHYAVGMGNQADALQAQTQISKIQDELFRLARERAMIEAELARILGRDTYVVMLNPAPPPMQPVVLNFESLREEALAQRPQLLALQSIAARNQKVLELARKEYYPDFDVRLSYGQRDNMLNGSHRPDMVSMTVAINLPLWRSNKIEPRIAASFARYHQALDLHQAQSNDIAAKLRQQTVTAEQNFKSAQLYRTTILPQARITVESSQAAYLVGQIDFLTLLNNQLTVFDYEITLATAQANYAKALAEIDLLTGSEH